MRRILIAAMLISGAAVAVPANAQPYGGGGQQIDRQLDQIRDRIHRAESRDAISKREEQRLLRQAHQIDRLHDRYRRNGLTRWERQDIQTRIQHLRQNIRMERFDDRRNDRYDDRRNDRYDERYDDRREDPRYSYRR